MKNISVERLVLAGFLAAAVALVLLAGIAWRSAVKSDEVAAQVTRTHQVLTAVGQIMFGLTRAETAQHGYDIYGKNDYLNSRDESLFNVVRSVGEAEQLIVVPEQMERLRQLKRLIVQRMEVFRLDHRSRNANGRIVVAGFNASLPIMEQIHQAIDRIVEIENSRLWEREAENALQRKIEYVSFGVLGVFLPLVFIFLFLRIRHAMCLSRDEETQFKKNKLELEQEGRKKSDFLAHMSHELRTPINSIMGFSELLKEGRLGKLTKAQTEYINDIYSNGQYMLALVNNILDLSKAEAGKMTLDLELVEISALLDNGISIIKEKVASQRVRLHLDIQPGLDDICIHADPLKARQIFYNLLSNAIKFTPDEGQLKLCMRRVPRTEVGEVSGYWPSRAFPLADSEFMEFLEISIADSGVGIPSAGLGLLFQPYSRINSGAARKFEGTGLGLVLVKHLVELHGGTEAVESSEGHGSRFIVWLPLRTNVGAATEPQELIEHQFVPEATGKMHKFSARAVVEQARQLVQQRTFVNV